MTSSDGAPPGAGVPCARCSQPVTVPDVRTGRPSPDHAELAPEYAAQARAAQLRLQKMEVVCGGCGRKLVIAARLAGRQARCPACGGSVQIPWPDEADIQGESSGSGGAGASATAQDADSPAAPDSAEPIEGKPVSARPEAARMRQTSRLGQRRKALILGVACAVLALLIATVLPAVLDSVLSRPDVDRVPEWLDETRRQELARPGDPNASRSDPASAERGSARPTDAGG